ncbi:hypothetical protein ACEN2J_14550 [Pseudorhodobacter sp. W20_MBD10_FR17]|uniref:hypothetical protein n=1 Tax=Pseudorhodobacter sp. W20_MBD10_FR17 TaxID=3240266 RepID=UPI003F998587
MKRKLCSPAAFVQCARIELSLDHSTGTPRSLDQARALLAPHKALLFTFIAPNTTLKLAQNTTEAL